MKKFFTQPINFASIIEGKGHAKCDLHQSIALRIHLLLVTNFGEFRSDSAFGCIIWEYDFENMPNINLWKDKMGANIKETLIRYEKRLLNYQVSIDIGQDEFTEGEGSLIRKIKRRIDFKVNANIKKTNEAFLFQETLYISPVWLD